METIEMLINEIESEILKAKKATFSQTDIVLNRDVMIGYVNRIRKVYPVELKQAEEITKTKDDILEQAKTYANSTMDKAEAEARAKISETEVVKKANEYAAQIRYQAQELYTKTDYEARQSAFALIENLEKVLNDTLDVLDSNKQKLIK